MSAIAASSRFAEPRTSETNRSSFHDVTASVKSWGRTGVLFGANFGLIFGAIFVAIPYSTDVLTFGTLGTLLVGAVECAVIAGGFAALGAALFADGARSRSTPQFEHILAAGRRSAVVYPREIPVAEWPARWAYPAQTPAHPLQQTSEEVLIMAPSLPDVQARFNSIDAWETGNTGP